MSHSDEGTLLSHLDGEISGDEAARLERHLEQCTACTEALEGLRRRSRLTASALQHLDTAPPVERARETVRRRLGARMLEPRRGRRLVRAAVVAVLLSMGVVAVASATPAGALMMDAWERVVATFSGDAGTDEPSPPPAPPDSREASGSSEAGDPPPVAEAPGGGDRPKEARAVGGIHMDGADRPVQIHLHGISDGAEITVELVEGTVAGVFGSVESRFRGGAGRLEVDVAGEAVRVEVPRGAPDVLLLVNGETWLVKDGPDLDVRGPVLERTEARIRFSGPGA